MRIVLIGAPGAGKGTQAKLLSKKLNIPQISTGDIFRDNIKNKTHLGNLVKSYMDQGLLVPDEITASLIRERLNKDDCKNGFILDGFPRTLAQANSLEIIAKDMDLTIDKVINFIVDDEQIIRRIAGRRICLNCGNTYHVDYHDSARKGICDNCNTFLTQRADDKEEIARNRIYTYYSQTEPLIWYYQHHNLVMEVDASRHINEIEADLINKLYHTSCKKEQAN